MFQLSKHLYFTKGGKEKKPPLQHRNLQQTSFKNPLAVFPIENLSPPPPPQRGEMFEPVLKPACLRGLWTHRCAGCCVWTAAEPSRGSSSGPMQTGICTPLCHSELLLPRCSSRSGTPAATETRGNIKPMEWWQHALRYLDGSKASGLILISRYSHLRLWKLAFSFREDSPDAYSAIGCIPHYKSNPTFGILM